MGDLDSFFDDADAYTDTSHPVDPVQIDEKVVKSKYCVSQVDDFTVDQANSVLAEAAVLKKPIAESGRDDSYWSESASDVYAALSEYRPELVDNPECEDRHKFMQGLMASQQYSELRAHTVGNPAVCDLGVTAILQQFAKTVRAVRDEKKRCSGGSSGAKKRTQPGQMSSDMLLATGAAKAAIEACKQVEDAASAQQALGMNSTGGDGGKLNAERLRSINQKIRNSPNLKRMLEWAGRFIRVTESTERTKTMHGVDDLVGIKSGSEISNLLPSELVQLVDLDLELLAMSRYVENRMLQFERRGNDNLGRGPLIISVDESGSMSGDKIETAKGLAMAVAWMARQQKRWAILIGFSGGTEGNVLMMPPGVDKSEELLDWLLHFYGNGTDLDVPLRVMPEFYRKAVSMGMASGTADYFCVTDGLVHCDDELKDEFLAFKKEAKMKMVTVAIDTPPGDLEHVSDRVLRVPKKITVENVGSLVSGN